MILRKIAFQCINDDSEYAYSIKKRSKFITNYIREPLKITKQKTNLPSVFFNFVE